MTPLLSEGHSHEVEFDDIISNIQQLNKLISDTFMVNMKISYCQRYSKNNNISCPVSWERFGEFLPEKKLSLKIA